MIHKFDGKGKILFFPKKWANSVTAWLSGVYSPKGTISVKNTSSPDDNGSLGLDVNIDAVTAEIVSRISGRYLSTSDIAAIRDIVRGFVDGSSVVWNGASFGVSMEWLVEQVLTLVGNGNQAAITASKSGKTTTIYADGTAIATILDGNNGNDGTSPVITSTKSGDNTLVYSNNTLIATLKNGKEINNVRSGTDADGQPSLIFDFNDGSHFGPVSLTTRSIESISDNTNDDGDIEFTINFSDGTTHGPLKMDAPSFSASPIEGGNELSCNGVKLCDIMDGEVTIEYADEHYAAIDHNHDETYSKLDHNHDEQYADVLHDHDDYAGKSHSHGALSSDGKISGCTSSDCFIVSNGGYLTHTELALRVSQVTELTNKYLANQLSLVGHTHNYAAADHTHNYALKSHMHSDYASQTAVSNLSAEVAGIQGSLEDCVTNESLQTTLSSYSNTETLQSTYATMTWVNEQGFITEGELSADNIAYTGSDSVGSILDEILVWLDNSVTPQDIGTTASAGTSDNAARADHVHKLPNPSASSYTNLGGGIGTSIGGGNSASSSAGTVNGSTGFTFTVLGAFNYAGDKSQIQTRTITVGMDGRIVSISACGDEKTFDTPTD